MKSELLSNRLMLFAAALLFSTGGAAIKASSLTSWQIAGFRSGIAAAALYLALPSARVRWTWQVWAIGAAYAATMILFVAANKLTTSANAIFLQDTAPLYLLLLGPLVLREPIRKVDIAVIAAVAMGAVLLLFGTKAAAVTAPDPGRGNLLALTAGLTWALTLTGLRWAANLSNAPLVAGNVIAFLACLPLALPVTRASPVDVAVVLYLGLFQIALAYIFLTRSLRQVPGLEAATLLLIEPVLNPVWTWMVHGERPGAMALGGGFIIVMAAFGGTIWRIKET
jgi:drug/metabolite transporter (DMT)-like permease